jgi:hypothetical protein
VDVRNDRDPHGVVRCITMYQILCEIQTVLASGVEIGILAAMVGSGKRLTDRSEQTER